MYHSLFCFVRLRINNKLVRLLKIRRFCLPNKITWFSDCQSLLLHKSPRIYMTAVFRTYWIHLYRYVAWSTISYYSLLRSCSMYVRRADVILVQTAKNSDFLNTALLVVRIILKYWTNESWLFRILYIPEALVWSYATNCTLYSIRARVYAYFHVYLDLTAVLLCDNYAGKKYLNAKTLENIYIYIPGIYYT